MTHETSLPRWFDAESPDGHPKYERASVVETVKLGLDTPHAAIFGQLEERMSVAVGDAIGWLKERCHAVMDDDPTGSTTRKRLLAAGIALDEAMVENLPPWGQKLVGQAPGPLYISKEALAVRLAWGDVHERQEEGKTVREWRCEHLHPKYQLQQFFLKVLPRPITGSLPQPLQAGMTQEVGQQLCSHLMLADSGTVALAAYPTTEQRDPALRRAAWKAALERACLRASPFPYERARDLDPSAYGPEDPRGDRLVNVDPDWRVVLSSPETRRSPLLFVTGGAVRLYRRVWQRPGKRPGDPDRVTRATFVAIPVDAEFLFGLDSVLRTAADWWRPEEIRRQFTPLLPAKQETKKKRGETGPLKGTEALLVVPIAYGRKRTEQLVLRALSRLPIQWSRVVHRRYRRGGGERDKWFLQLTIGYAAPAPFPTRVFGIHFGLENVYYWALVEDRGPDAEPHLLEEGTSARNLILAHGLAQKDDLEWDQRKQRWVGGRTYAHALKTDTHVMVDEILRLARAHGVESVPAGLGVERIRWVPKGRGSPAVNRRFSAWNYGQLRMFLGYKAPAAGIWATEITLTKSDRQWEDAEQARRLARIGMKRLHKRRRRAAESAAEERDGAE